MKHWLGLTLLFSTAYAWSGSFSVGDLMNLQQANVKKISSTEHDNHFKSSDCFLLGKMAMSSKHLGEALKTANADKKTSKYLAKVEETSQKNKYCTTDIDFLLSPDEWKLERQLKKISKWDEKLDERLFETQLEKIEVSVDVKAQVQKLKKEIELMPDYSKQVGVPYHWKVEVCFQAGRVQEAAEVLKAQAIEAHFSHWSDVSSVMDAANEINNEICNNIRQLDKYGRELYKLREAITLAEKP